MTWRCGNYLSKIVHEACARSVDPPGFATPLIKGG